MLLAQSHPHTCPSTSPTVELAAPELAPAAPAFNPLDPDQLQLQNALLDLLSTHNPADLSPGSIATHLKVQLHIILDLLGDSLFQARLAAALALADLIHHRRILAAQSVALAALQAIVASPAADAPPIDPIERRRAAAALLRASARRAPKLAPRPPIAPDAPAPIAPLRPVDPRLTRSPLGAASAILHRFANDGDHNGHEGLRLLHTTVIEGQKASQTFDSFAENPPEIVVDLINHAHALVHTPADDLELDTIGSDRVPSSKRLSIHVSLIPSGSLTRHHFTLTLQPTWWNTSLGNSQVWSLQSISRRDLDDEPDFVTSDPGP